MRLAELTVHQVHLLIYVVPICIKFQFVCCFVLLCSAAYSHAITHRHDMLYASFVLLGVLALFKPYPTLSDPGLFISLFSLFPEIYPCE